MTDTKMPTPPPVWQDPRAIALLLVATLTTMANATISPALVGLAQKFSQTPNAETLVQFLVPAPSLTVVLCAPIAGILADKYGRRSLLILGVVLFAISGSAGLYLPNLPLIFASRFALGVAVAMIMTSQTALIGDYFVGSQRATLMGLQISARNFGGFIFISMAGWLTAISAELPFAIYGLAGIFLPFVCRTIRPATITVQETTAFTAPLATPWTWMPALIALAVLQTSTNLVFFVVPTQLPFYLASLNYNSATMTGATLGLLTLTGGCTALFYARIKPTLHHSGTYAVGYGLMALGFALFSSASQTWIIFVGAGAIGAGFALVMPNFVAIALKITPAEKRGIASGLLTTAIFLGQIISPFAIIPAINHWEFDRAFSAVAGLLTIMAGVSIIARLTSAKANHRTKF